MKFTHIGTVIHTTFGNCQHRVAHLLVNNYKQGTMQTMHVFPHASLWHLDYYFSHAVFFACSDHSGEYVYPTFGEQAAKESSQTNKKDSSRIVKHFTDCLSCCVKWFKENRDRMRTRFNDLTHGICSHSSKKYAVREMGRELNPIYVIFRAGWAVRNAHTLFDYLVKDVVHDIKAAKICAGWTAHWFGGIWGGCTNSVDDLTVEEEKFMPFCHCLFQYQKDR